MPNENLTAALQGTLNMLNEQGSPLAEATPDSVNELLDRVNSAFAEGLPERLTDATLLRLIQIYRAEALRWQQDEQKKTTRVSKTSRRPLGEVLDLDL